MLFPSQKVHSPRLVPQDGRPLSMKRFSTSKGKQQGVGGLAFVLSSCCSAVEFGKGPAPKRKVCIEEICGSAGVACTNSTNSGPAGAENVKQVPDGASYVQVPQKASGYKSFRPIHQKPSLVQRKPSYAQSLAQSDMQVMALGTCSLCLSGWRPAWC